MFDSLFGTFTLLDWSPGFGFGRRARRLLARGEAATATIVGIKVTRTGTGDESSVGSYASLYALLVRGPGSATRRLGCRQLLEPHGGRAALGSEVAVRVRGRRVIIDWPATLAAHGEPHGEIGERTTLWKPKRTPPADGVQDPHQNGDRRRIGRASPGRVTVLRVVARKGLLGASENVDVDVLLTTKRGETRQALLPKLLPPLYAAPLLKVGTVLPVGVDQDGARITVDWLAAANGEVSVDPAPPQATRDPAAPQTSPASSTGGRLVGTMAGLMAGALERGGLPADAPGGEAISFETFVAVSAGLVRDRVDPPDHDAYAGRHGVPAGRWGPASRAWQARMATDWKLGARYGDAYARELQGGGSPGQAGGAQGDGGGPHGGAGMSAG